MMAVNQVTRTMNTIKSLEESLRHLWSVMDRAQELGLNEDSEDFGDFLLQADTQTLAFLMTLEDMYTVWGDKKGIEKLLR